MRHILLFAFIALIPLQAAAYTDVRPGMWYEDAVEMLVKKGILDGTQETFRPADRATRAEFVKLLVEMNGGIVDGSLMSRRFADVSPDAWYAQYMDEAGMRKWVTGDGNCLGSRGCLARPDDDITRAEAAAMAARAFELKMAGETRLFMDVPAGAWYATAVYAVAGACGLDGDAATGYLRPTDPINRAEMVTMLHRIDMNLLYGVDCKLSSTRIQDVSLTSPTTVQVTFTEDVDAKTATDRSNYRLPDYEIVSATAVNARVVELLLGKPMTTTENRSLVIMSVRDASGSLLDTTLFPFSPADQD